jgi:hypothetical protein
MEHEDLKHEDPRRSTKVHEDELDAQLLTLFRTAEAPAPSADFVARTMHAVTRAPLPSGRRALHGPLASLLGWAALIAGVALSALAVVLTQPIFASMFSHVISRGVGMGVWLMQFRSTALAMLDVLTTTGLAVSRAAATREGTTGLLLIGVMGALSLSVLHKLLISEGEGKQWQELS